MRSPGFLSKAVKRARKEQRRGVEAEAAPASAARGSVFACGGPGQVSAAPGVTRGLALPRHDRCPRAQERGHSSCPAMWRTESKLRRRERRASQADLVEFANRAEPGSQAASVLVAGGSLAGPRYWELRGRDGQPARARDRPAPPEGGRQTFPEAESGEALHGCSSRNY